MTIRPLLHHSTRGAVGIVFTSLLVALVFGAAAFGQTPFVDTLIVPSFEQDFNVPDPTFVYIDTPGTAKTLNLPAGIAVITWAVNAQEHAGSRFVASDPHSFWGCHFLVSVVVVCLEVV